MVDAAHGLGLMVFLDVVYNHFGPDGAYIHAFAKPFFREDIKTPWGASRSTFAGPRCATISSRMRYIWMHGIPVRRPAVRRRARHQRGPEFLDDPGRRFIRDATSSRVATFTWCWSTRTTRRSTSSCWPRRHPFRRAMDGRPVHHLPARAADGRERGLLRGFPGRRPGKLARCHGRRVRLPGRGGSKHSGRPRGEPSGTPADHGLRRLPAEPRPDLATAPLGERLSGVGRSAGPPCSAATTALLLLSPFIPLLFMGEEVAAKTPFLFFTAHNEDLAKLVREGRRAEFKHFAAFQDPERRERIPIRMPPARSTRRCPRCRATAASFTTCLRCAGSG